MRCAIEKGHLESSANCDQGGTPPSQRCEVKLDREAVEQTGDGTCYCTAGSAGRCSQPVDSSKMRSVWRSFFDHDQKKGEGENRRQVPYGQASEQTRVEQVLREKL